MKSMVIAGGREGCEGGEGGYWRDNNDGRRLNLGW